MNVPKRHHWWPELQSKYWTGPDGKIHVVRRDGTYFTSGPDNIGLEGQLYTRYELNGEKDVSIERWFSSEIEGPFSKTLEFVTQLPGLRRERFVGDLSKAALVQELGFVVENYRETISLTSEHRLSLASYLAALLVRNPRYLRKLQAFHASENLQSIRQQISDSQTKLAISSLSLDDMLRLYTLYRERIARADFVFVTREASSEFLFSDVGLSVEEPWRSQALPFDIHAPLTPDLAVEVMPVPDPRFHVRALVMRAKKAGIKRLNRITVGAAGRFVFSRSAPPIEFIRKNFGVPAPKPFGFRWKDGKLETKYDPQRDRRV